MKSGIYQIINSINNKIYIGSAKDIRIRWNIHKSELRKNKHSNNKLQNAYNKYGEENFEFTIIEYVSDMNMLIEREQYYIDTFKPEYNILPKAGNSLGCTRSEETKKKISEANIGKLRSEETKKKMSESHLGDKNSMYGKHHSEEFKKNLSETLKGSKSPMYGKIREKSPNYGKRHSEETKKKISESCKGLLVGEKNPSCKITEEEAIIIIDLLNSKYKIKDIVTIINVSYGIIWRIKNHITWKYLTKNMGGDNNE